MHKKTINNANLLENTSLNTPKICGSATGNPLNKCALKPGHSLMDWIRLGNSGIDLSGTEGRTISVTKQELSKHNTRNDGWMAIRGIVYNVTHYMDYHPGGVEELMRGVGTDATKLFNEVHAWVNYSQLLDKCQIGPLINGSIAESFKLNNKTLFAKPPQLLKNLEIIPRLDWIQKRNDITLNFYTKQFCNPGILIRNLNCQDKHVQIWILIGSYIHKFDFELHGHINWPPKDVEIFTESGKIEINFEKDKNQLKLWSDLGKNRRTKILASSVEEATMFDFNLSFKYQFNKDSFAILLKNENIFYIPPVGYHIALEAIVNNEKISKSYTPVSKKYLNKFPKIDMDALHYYFLIKQYTHANSFSHYLCHLNEGTTLKVSLPKGTLKLSTLSVHRRFCFLAAGSGLTPFLSLIDHLLKRNTNRIEVLKLLYFNKTLEDIWCNDILSNMFSKDERFELINILSNAEESWTGQKGRVSSELLFPIVNKLSMEKITYIVVCGPTDFNKNVEEMLKELNFPDENVFNF